MLPAGHIAATLVALVAGAAPAAAATLTGSAEVDSDYRFRGLSLSDRRPVGEATLDLAAGPWFAGVEGVTASRGRSAAGALRRSGEIDLSAGWSRSLGLLTPTVGAIGYLRPGGETASAEVFATLAAGLGPATLTVGGNLAPGQAAAPGGNLYLFARLAAGVPRTPLTLRAAVGRERGALASGGFGGGTTKLDYSGGVAARLFRIVGVGLDYVGNDLPTAGPGRLQRNREDGVVLRASLAF